MQIERRSGTTGTCHRCFITTCARSSFCAKLRNVFDVLRKCGEPCDQIKHFDCLWKGIKKHFIKNYDEVIGYWINQNFFFDRFDTKNCRAYWIQALSILSFKFQELILSFWNLTELITSWVSVKMCKMCYLVTLVERESTFITTRGIATNEIRKWVHCCVIALSKIYG